VESYSPEVLRSTHFQSGIKRADTRASINLPHQLLYRFPFTPANRMANRRFRRLFPVDALSLLLVNNRT
jgi:hypothetical protein